MVPVCRFFSSNRLRACNKKRLRLPRKLLVRSCLSTINSPSFSMMLSILLTVFGRPAFIYFSGKWVEEKPMEPYLFSPYLEALHRLPYALLSRINYFLYNKILQHQFYPSKSFTSSPMESFTYPFHT